MVKAGEDLRLPLETSEAVRISRKRFRQETSVRLGGSASCRWPATLRPRRLRPIRAVTSVMAESVADVQRHS